jgi:predicted phage terminase large subunit-like protein
LAEGGRVIITMTRWHEDDLVGWVLEQASQGGDKWVVLSFPALCEQEGKPLDDRKVGDPLWPERYPKEWHERKKRKTSSRVWSALYQQHPSPVEGCMFEKQHWKILKVCPPLARVVRYWDRAPGGDISAGVKMGVTDDGRFVVPDCVGFAASPLNTKRGIKNIAEQDGRKVVVALEQEIGPAGPFETMQYREDLKEHVDRIVPMPIEGQKHLRADPWSAEVEAENVYLIEGEWVHEFIEEHASFPYGISDDKVDAAGGAYRFLLSDKHEEPPPAEPGSLTSGLERGAEWEH